MLFVAGHQPLNNVAVTRHTSCITLICIFSDLSLSEGNDQQTKPENYKGNAANSSADGPAVSFPDDVQVKVKDEKEGAEEEKKVCY